MKKKLVLSFCKCCLFHLVLFLPEQILAMTVKKFIQKIVIIKKSNYNPPKSNYNHTAKLQSLHAGLASYLRLLKCDASERVGVGERAGLQGQGQWFGDQEALARFSP